jgi:hypothetical protein
MQTDHDRPTREAPSHRRLSNGQSWGEAIQRAQ